MRLIMCERQDLETPEVTIAYREITPSVQRVSEYVRNVERTILCKKDNEEYGIFINDIFYAIEYYILPEQAFYLFLLNILWTIMAVASYICWSKIMKGAEEK